MFQGITTVTGEQIFYSVNGTVTERRDILADPTELPDTVIRKIIADYVMLPSHLRTTLPFIFLEVVIERNLMNYFNVLMRLQSSIEQTINNDSPSPWQILPMDIKIEETEDEGPQTAPLELQRSPDMYGRKENEPYVYYSPKNLFFASSPRQTHSSDRRENDRYDNDGSENIFDLQENIAVRRQSSNFSRDSQISLNTRVNCRILDNLLDIDMPNQTPQPTPSIFNDLMESDLLDQPPQPSTSTGRTMRPRNRSCTTKKLLRPKSAPQRTPITKAQVDKAVREGMQKINRSSVYQHKCRVDFCDLTFKDELKRDSHEATAHSIGRCFVCECGLVSEGIFR